MGVIRSKRATINRIIRHYKRRSTVKGIAFSLTAEQFGRLIFDDCFYCGAEPSLTNKEISLPFNGIDRVDNNKGYTPDNSITCCATCNSMKGASNYEKFIDHVRKIKLERGI